MTLFKAHPDLTLGGISHGFFGRRGGVSSSTYSSLNAGHGSGDIHENVTENRARIAAAIGAQPQALLSCHQIHSRDVMVVDRPWQDRPKADAIVTKTPGIACTALHADCAPVLFADPKARVIGAAHAGWRGAVAGITDATIEAMESIGADRANIRAVIGPCISAPNYEVGPDFRAQFVDADAQFFTPGNDDRLHFDLKAYLLARLSAAGITSAAALPDCTYGAPAEYFSYRYNTHRNIADYGRNISAIMLTSAQE